MKLHAYDRNRNPLVTPHERGRQAFWLGRGLSSNPFIRTLAAEWRTGWRSAERECHARGGQKRNTAKKEVIHGQ